MPEKAAWTSAEGRLWVSKQGEYETHVKLLAKDAAQKEADVLQDGVAARVRAHVPILLRHVLQTPGGKGIQSVSQLPAVRLRTKMHS